MQQDMLARVREAEAQAEQLRQAAAAEARGLLRAARSRRRLKRTSFSNRPGRKPGRSRRRLRKRRPG